MITASYVVELRPLATGVGRAPAIVRLRRALKCLLRAYGLRCVSVREGNRTNTTNRPDRTNIGPARAATLFLEMRAATQ